MVQNSSLIEWFEIQGQMLKAPPLIPRTYSFLVIWCNFRYYNDSLVFRSQGVWLIGCVTNGLNNQLLVSYSDHGFNNELLPGNWIANKWKFVIQIFVILIPIVFWCPELGPSLYLINYWNTLDGNFGLSLKNAANDSEHIIASWNSNKK